MQRKITRRVGTRTVKQSFLIVCEGRNTEPEYFNAFRLSSAQVKAVGKGLGTTELVKEAIALRREENRKGKIYDQYWVVFDKDDFTDGDFGGAIRLAEASGFQVAWSNQAFEFWLILHFTLYRGLLHRGQYPAMLTKLGGIPYTKKSGFMTSYFNLLYPRTDTAIHNAEVVLGDFQGVAPAKSESSTTVQKLVGELKKFL